MLNLLRPATSLMLAAVMLALTMLMLPQISNSSTAFAQDKKQSPDANQKNSAVKVLKGEAVKAHVQQLRLKDKALNRALKDMEKWGKLPNWEASAFIKEMPAAKKETASLKFLPASMTQDQYWTDGNGNELILITAYGAETHWDGTIYTYDASAGQSSTYNGVVNDLVSDDPETSDVVDELYYPPDGGDPYREGGGSGCGGYDGGGGVQDHRIIADQPCFSKAITQPNPTDSGKGNYVNASSSTVKPVGFVGWFKRYFRCIKRCMALATQFCFQRNYNNFRNFFICLAIGGTAASITCAFNTNACS